MNWIKKKERKKPKNKEKEDQFIGHQKLHGYISTASSFTKEK